MRISDWSSDVCSSDLGAGRGACAEAAGAAGDLRRLRGLAQRVGKGPGVREAAAVLARAPGAPNSQGCRPQALPTDKPRKRGMSGNSASCMVMVPGDLTAALHARSRDMDVTLFVTLLSAYALLLADFAGQRDMVI